MTLTKTDLSAIRQVVKEETLPRFQKLEKGQRKIARELNRWTFFFDRDYIKLLRRVVKIENKLEIQAPEF